MTAAPGVQFRHFRTRAGSEELGCSAASPGERAAAAGPALTAVLLHGAGTADRAPLAGMMADFAARGVHALTFDFAGHGDSTGLLPGQSLQRRFEQARAVIDRHVPGDHRLVLVGFSMSGQTVADLAAHHGTRVAALGLCAPAVYAADAWSVPFGPGFTRIIRAPGSWRSSPAFDVFRSVRSRAVLAVPETDAVIPEAVTDAVTAALGSGRARFARLLQIGADHRLGAWFAARPEPRGRFVDSLLDSLLDPLPDRLPGAVRT
ncbi:hypothetical protein KNE206_37150 [Kitasatospora sp. NE20-6]|uniref:alpha/beta fold hydrolase n=1 Tax=Kitasatospora sp. NE20-6 TaxID=2859066 RepID=UPI0034DB9B89